MCSLNLSDKSLPILKPSEVMTCSLDAISKSFEEAVQAGCLLGQQLPVCRGTLRILRIVDQKGRRPDGNVDKADQTCHRAEGIHEASIYREKCTIQDEERQENVKEDKNGSVQLSIALHRADAEWETFCNKACSVVTTARPQDGSGEVDQEVGAPKVVKIR